MHIANLTDDENRPEGVRQPIIPELDLEGWDTIEEHPQGHFPDFSRAVAMAASDSSKAIATEPGKQNVSEARALFVARLKLEADKLAQETGYSFGFQAWAYIKKPKAAYNLWKKVVPMFKECPQVLDLSATALAKMLDQHEEAFTVTRDMLYDELNELAVKDAERLLQRLGVNMVLQKPVSISSLRRQFLERREALAGVETDEFVGKFSIRGNTAYVNGRQYKIQQGKSGKPRIQFRGDWLRLDVLQAICLDRG